MSLIDDLEILAHELECDPTYNFKGLMTSDGDKFTDKLARVRAGIARVAELEAVALNALYHHQGAGSPVVLAEVISNAKIAAGIKPGDFLVDWCRNTRARIKALEEIVFAADRAIGDHNAPNDCYATGPMTGSPVLDLVQCPACAYLTMREEVAIPKQ